MTDIARPAAAGLAAFRGYTLEAEAVTEEFLDTRLGPEQAFALLSQPADGTPSEGWLLCPSIGQEHGNLRRLEASIARALARQGAAALRIRPDVSPEGSLAGMDLDARITEVLDGASVLRERGIAPAGVFGAVSGAMVAFLVCENLAVGSLVAVEPVRRGRQYVRESLRRQAVTDLMSADDTDALSPLRQLETDGVTWVRGVRLTQTAYERIASVDVLDALRGFRGRALLLGVSPAGTVSPTLAALEKHLRSLGGSPTVEVIEDRLPVPLGEYHYENAGPIRHDTRIDLDRRLTERTTDWIAADLP